MRFLITFSLIMVQFLSHAAIITVFSNGGATNSLFIPSNTVATFLGCHLGNEGELSIISDTNPIPAIFFNSTAESDTKSSPIVGPATISIFSFTNQGSSYFTVETHSTIPFFATNSIPSTAVVIPSDTSGPVSIILESSTDLVNWLSALPGSYGTTTSNRFFRVRASR